MSEKIIPRQIPDDGRHEGKIAEIKRLAETEHQLHDYYTGQDVIPRMRVIEK